VNTLSTRSRARYGAVAHADDLDAGNGLGPRARDHDAAAAPATECLAAARLTQSTVRRAWLAVRGQIALAERRSDAAEHALGEAITVARLIRNPTQLWRTHMELARLHSARGQDDVAGADQGEARRVVEGRLES